MAATIRDVAKHAGLSTGTVSKYINGKTVKASTKRAIESAIKELHFRPNSIAKGLRNAKSFSVAILLPMLESSFCTSMISTIESTLSPLGYSIIVCECHNNEEMELRKAQYLVDRMVDGIILIPYASDGKQIALIKQNAIPIVLLDQEIQNHTTDCIVLDNDMAGQIATSHLIHYGHKKIAMISGQSEHYTTIGRLNGYKKVMQENKLEILPEYIQCGEYSIDGGYSAMRRLCTLENRPTAIFISNYDMTIGAYLAINDLNLQIPEDISIVGFDNFPLANVVTPPLSFIAQPTAEMGNAAGKLLYRRMQGDYTDFPKVSLYKPTLHSKKSVSKLN